MTEISALREEAPKTSLAPSTMERRSRKELARNQEEGPHQKATTPAP